jgi:hypothetical protein
MLREREQPPAAGYLSRPKALAADGGAFVTPAMRAIVASWMCEAAAEFGLQQETLFLAVALLDRFQACSPTVRAPRPAAGRAWAPIWAKAGPRSPQEPGPVFIFPCRLRLPWGRHATPACHNPPENSPRQGVPRTVLQLVAVACLMVASKQDEVRCATPLAPRSHRSHDWLLPPTLP